MLRNSTTHWGWLHIVFHWLTALTVIGLFVSGLWMVELDYYSPWYNRAPAWHKSVGVLLFCLVAIRLLWRLANELPADEPGPRWEHGIAHAVHWLIYLLLFAIIATGYLIPTATGDPRTFPPARGRPVRARRGATIGATTSLRPRRRRLRATTTAPERHRLGQRARPAAGGSVPCGRRRLATVDAGPV
ncbi:MAG: cytochrome b, partial [Proteobacteria bacterium]|nr:cytochrome b [Pseudomonadota bacterium]